MENLEQRSQILAYARGASNGGAAIDAATKKYMLEKNEKDYRIAQRAVIADAMAAEEKTMAAQRADRREFAGRTAAYADHFNLTRAEAIKLVAAHDPRMAKVYQEDPMGPINVAAAGESRPEASITIKPWEPLVHATPAVTRFANIIFSLPRDEYGFITLRQVVDSMRPYPNLTTEATGEKMDEKARVGISILGLPGFSSENYRTGLDWAKNRYPALNALWSVGRWSAEAVRQTLPQVLIYD